jgi:hypothetical protein
MSAKATLDMLHLGVAELVSFSKQDKEESTFHFRMSLRKGNNIAGTSDMHLLSKLHADPAQFDTLVSNWGSQYLTTRWVTVGAGQLCILLLMVIMDVKQICSWHADDIICDVRDTLEN